MVIWFLSYSHTELPDCHGLSGIRSMAIRGDPWLDLSCVRSAAVMVLGGPGWSWIEGPGRSGKVREVVFEILNCLKNPGRSGTVRDDPGRGQDPGRSVVGSGGFGKVPASSVTAPQRYRHHP